MNKFEANNATNNDIIKYLFCALTNYFLTKCSGAQWCAWVGLGCSIVRLDRHWFNHQLEIETFAGSVDTYGGKLSRASEHCSLLKANKCFDCVLIYMSGGKEI